MLADPATHAAIDGTGWVRESLDRRPLTDAGQIFRMAMYHPNHPDGDYQMANRVQVFDPPRAIAWQPGQESADDRGARVRRLDLALRPRRRSARRRPTVTLTYDWSAVPPYMREYIQFPPFGRDAPRQLAAPPRRDHHLDPERERLRPTFLVDRRSYRRRSG